MSWKHFKSSELACRCCGKELMNDDFMRKIEALREAAGFAFPVTSAYRCPKHNNNVSRTGLGGPHTTGRAIDIGVRGAQAYWLICNAGRYGITGMGVQQKGASRFIHLDDLDNAAGCPRETVWSY